MNTGSNKEITRSGRTGRRHTRIEWAFRPSTRRALFLGVLLGQAAVLLGGELLADYWLRTEMSLAPVWADRMLVFRMSVVLGVFLMTGAMLVLGSRRYKDAVERSNAELKHEVNRQVLEGLARRDALIFGLAKLADYRDTDTGAHLERIGMYAGLLADRLRGVYPEIDDAWTERLVLASSLHDIGKVGIPDRILLKPGRLEPDERAVMERHAQIGADTLIAIRSRLGPDAFIDMGVEVALQHHEKWDGSGYPYGLGGADISPAARIVSMADFYDAVTSKRVYKDAMPHAQAHELIVSLRGSHFDPAVVDAYLACESEFDAVRLRAASDLTHPTPILEETARRSSHEQGAGSRLAA